MVCEIGGLGACPKKSLENTCPEIDSGGFWHLADYPTLVSKTTCMLDVLQLVYS